MIGKKIYLDGVNSGVIAGITDSKNIELFKRYSFEQELDYYLNDFSKPVSLEKLDDLLSCVYIMDDINIFNKYFELVDGTLDNINDSSSLVVSEYYATSNGYKVGDEISGGYNHPTCYVKGIYKNNSNNHEFTADRIIGKDLYLSLYKKRISSSSHDFFLPKEDLNIKMIKVNDLSIENINYNAEAGKKDFITSFATCIVIVTIFIYFEERAKMMSNIKNVGILRAIGASRSRIASIYSCDAFVEAIHTALIGYIACGLVIGFVDTKLSDILNTNKVFFYQHYLYYLVMIVMIMVFIIFGALPSLLLTRKTPSEIISKYDI